MVWRQRLFLLFSLFCLVPSVGDASDFARLLEDGRIERSDGSIIRLAAIRIVEQKGLHRKAFALINQRLKQPEWVLSEPIVRDRYGNEVGMIDLGTGQTLQHLLIEQGLARVYPQADEGGDLTELLKAETQARAQKIGLWKLKTYRVITAEEAIPQRFDLRNYYQLVTGQVLAVAKVRGNIYLNFGEDWREDFTIMIPKPFAKSVAAQGLNYKDLEGKQVRVRGWFRLYGGPLIDVTDARQIEVLD
jgi:micrococcal nuclease